MPKPLEVSASRLCCAVASKIRYSCHKCKVWKMFRPEKSKVCEIHPVTFLYFFNFWMGASKGGSTSKIRTISVEASYLVTMKTSA